jgi:hypothetical protein
LLYNRLLRFDLFGLDEVGHDDLLIPLLDSAVLVGPLGGEFDLVLVSGMQVERGEG